MKKSHSKDSLIPTQHEGTKKDIEHTVKAADENDARALFMIGRNRLMNVNHWHDYAEPVTATFKLSDEHGKELNRRAEVGDYFKIDLPAPGPTESNGIDWVRIEAIEDRSNPNGNEELIAIRVRPAPDPTAPTNNVAHFFKDSATSSFVVERNGKTVSLRCMVGTKNQILRLIILLTKCEMRLSARRQSWVFQMFSGRTW